MNPSNLQWTKPIWRENNYSGTLFQSASIIQKCTITASADYKGYALKGFLNGTHTLSEERKKEILQLTKLFGAEATNYVDITRKYGVTTTHLFPIRALMGHENGHPTIKTFIKR
jgi:hypothetical protein